MMMMIIFIVVPFSKKKKNFKLFCVGGVHQTMETISLQVVEVVPLCEDPPPLE